MYPLPCISTAFKLQYIYFSDPIAAVYLTMLHMPPKKAGKLPRRAACVIISEEMSLFLTSASSAEAIATAVMRQSPGANGAPTANIDRDSAATTCIDVVNDATCPSEPTTRVDISSVCANAVDQHHCRANAVDQHRCDSVVDALLSGLLGDQKSQTNSSLARSHSSINTSSNEARNAGSLEHQLIRASLAPTTRAANRRGVNMLRRHITSVCPGTRTFPVSRSNLAGFFIHMLAANYASSTVLTTVPAISYSHKIVGLAYPADNFNIKK